MSVCVYPITMILNNTTPLERSLMLEIVKNHKPTKIFQLFQLFAILKLLSAKNNYVHRMKYL